MTYRDGKRALTRMLLNAQRLDHLPQINHKGCQDARDTMDDLFAFPGTQTGTLWEGAVLLSNPGARLSPGSTEQNWATLTHVSSAHSLSDSFKDRSLSQTVAFISETYTRP